MIKQYRLLMLQPDGSMRTMAMQCGVKELFMVLYDMWMDSRPEDSDEMPYAVYSCNSLGFPETCLQEVPDFLDAYDAVRRRQAKEAQDDFSHISWSIMP